MEANKALLVATMYLIHLSTSSPAAYGFKSYGDFSHLRSSGALSECYETKSASAGAGEILIYNLGFIARV